MIKNVNGNVLAPPPVPGGAMQADVDAMYAIGATARAWVSLTGITVKARPIARRKWDDHPSIVEHRDLKMLDLCSCIVYVHN